MWHKAQYTTRNAQRIEHGACVSFALALIPALVWAWSMVCCTIDLKSLGALPAVTLSPARCHPETTSKTRFAT